MSAGLDKAKRCHRDLPQDPLDEPLPPQSPLLLLGPMHAVEQLGGGDGRNGDRLLGDGGQALPQVEASPLPLDQDRAV